MKEYKEMRWVTRDYLEVGGYLEVGTGTSTDP